MAEQIIAADTAHIWQAEAAWAAQEWRALFDPELSKLRTPGAPGSRFYALAGEAARRAFEQVADQLLQRVSDLLSQRSLAHHIGPPNECAAMLVGPLEKKAIDSLAKLRNAATNPAFHTTAAYAAPLDKNRQKIETRAETLRAAIASRVVMRLEELGSRTAAQSRMIDDRPNQLAQGAFWNQDEMPKLRACRAFSDLDLHPEIAKAVGKLFQDGHYANAVEDACKALDGLVQNKSGRLDISGTDLMQTVFSPKAPILRFGPLTTESDRSEQQGMMFLYAGAMLALRNPRAHRLIEDGPEQALEYIGFLSLLAKALDRAIKV